MIQRVPRTVTMSRIVFGGLLAFPDQTVENRQQIPVNGFQLFGLGMPEGPQCSNYRKLSEIWGNYRKITGRIMVCLIFLVIH